MIAALFPGQGSQMPGMGRDLYENVPESRKVFDRVSKATGLSITEICFEHDEATLRQTQNAQIALYTTGLAAWEAFRAKSNSELRATAGHSVGEYTALAAAGALSIEDGAKLVQRRGEIMAEAGVGRPGTMAAVLGMDVETLEAACAKASEEGVCVVANDNCPGQLVISGDYGAVQAACGHAQDMGARRIVPLNVSGAFHSPLMAHSSQTLAEALSSAEFKEPQIQVWSNVSAKPETGGWPALLERQLSDRVRWRQTIQGMIEAGIDTFIECGAGEVLCGLIKRVDRSAKCLLVTDRATLDSTLEALA